MEYSSSRVPVYYFGPSDYFEFKLKPGRNKDMKKRKMKDVLTCLRGGVEVARDHSSLEPNRGQSPGPPPDVDINVRNAKRPHYATPRHRNCFG